jgi:hypothetical protein
MDLLVSGAVIFAISAVLFWYCLPRGGKTHRFVGTELEPYIAVAFRIDAFSATSSHDPGSQHRFSIMREKGPPALPWSMSCMSCRANGSAGSLSLSVGSMPYAAGPIAAGPRRGQNWLTETRLAELREEAQRKRPDPPCWRDGLGLATTPPGDAS